MANRHKASRRSSSWRALLVTKPFRDGFLQRDRGIAMDDSYASNPRGRWLYEIGRLFNASPHSSQYRGKPLPTRSLDPVAIEMARALQRATTAGDFPFARDRS